MRVFGVFKAFHERVRAQDCRIGRSLNSFRTSEGLPLTRLFFKLKSASFWAALLHVIGF